MTSFIRFLDHSKVFWPSLTPTTLTQTLNLLIHHFLTVCPGSSTPKVFLVILTSPYISFLKHPYILFYIWFTHFTEIFFYFPCESIHNKILYDTRGCLNSKSFIKQPPKKIGILIQNTISKFSKTKNQTKKRPPKVPKN